MKKDLSALEAFALSPVETLAIRVYEHCNDETAPLWIGLDKSLRRGYRDVARVLLKEQKLDLIEA